jgi:hypothetical protein
VRASDYPDDSPEARTSNHAGISSRDLTGTRELPDTARISGHCGRGEGKRSADYGDDQCRF